MLDFEPGFFEKKAMFPTRSYSVEVDANNLREASRKLARYFPVTIEPAIPDYMTDVQKSEYGRLIGSVLSIVDSLSYKLEEHHQTSGTYSYYIYFVPCDWGGDVMDELVEVEFRISEHDQSGQQDYSYNKQKKTLFVGFRFDGQSFHDMDSMLDAVRSMMENIKSGIF